ncbi:serine/threonine-protein kinase [Nocardia sp. NPDC052112]|uniref:serine/threonine-protein kinase n=1 Tax=Nocardia sp. NPDC052112 TaxID=3155646 RepID=UPI0034185FC5
MKTLADRYRVTSAIGRGGMGEVWSGLDLRLNRMVAIKIVAPELASDSDTRRRFNREARITARLHHPGVPAVYDFGTDGELFLVMELVPGESVGMLIGEQGSLPVGWAACIAAQVCAVLTAAHRVELIHRDLKPENLVLTPNGMVKVIDFGAATSLKVGEYSAITEWGNIPGSVHYMAPELLEGESASNSSDLYSVGCLLYEMLTGPRPFRCRNDSAELGWLRAEEPRPMNGVPSELEELTRQLLAKDPAQRPTDALAVHRLLLPWIRGLTPLPGWIERDLSTDPIHLYLHALSNPM